MASRIVRCRFPFPQQNPPVEMPEPCSEKCPNYDAASFAQRAEIEVDDSELVNTIRDFAAWFYAPGQEASLIDEQVRYAASLYTRQDHSGTCVPKTMLFAHYKHLQFSSGWPMLELSPAAAAALRGEEIASWPEGGPARGRTWNVMFAQYSRGYD